MGGSQPWDALVRVGRIARPHGLRGQVMVSPDTDFIAERFRVGATMWTRSERGEELLTVTTARVQNGRPVVGFEGFASVEEAQRLVGQELRVPEDALVPLAEGTYYWHQLMGCHVTTTVGEDVGTVRRVDGGLGASLLVVDGPRGEVLVPLTAGICVEVDVVARRIRIEPPAGLLELNESRRRAAARRVTTPG